MKPLIAALVAAAVLVIGGLPALALVLDDDEPGLSQGSHGSPWEDAQREDHPGSPWTHRHDKGWGGGTDERGGMPPAVAECLKLAFKIQQKYVGDDRTRPGQPDDGVPGDLGRHLKGDRELMKKCLEARGGTE